LPNGTKGDHPITDILVHGLHPYPEEVEKSLLQVHNLNHHLVDFMDIWSWSAEDGWQSALEECDQMIEGYSSKGNAYLHEIVARETHPVAKHNLAHLLNMIENPGKHMYYSTKSGPASCLIPVLVLTGLAWRLGVLAVETLRG
jgi:hypothetical protein